MEIALVARVASQIMSHLCNCPEHGYSQLGRYGTVGSCAVGTDAGTIYVTKGDRNCSSAVCESWELALATCCGDTYGINRYNSTWTMKEMFLNSGLFEWHGINDFSATCGDIYLDIDCHTAMCIDGSADNDLLAEFSLAETGGIDGEPGDQTGNESSIHWFYEANWDGILHYIGGDQEAAETHEATESSVTPDIEEMAWKVVRGEYGTGNERREALGAMYDEVQARVNEIMTGDEYEMPEIQAALPYIDDIAMAVIRGEYGNGAERREKLGELYDVVQERVNELMQE